MRFAIFAALPVLALALAEWQADFPVDKKALGPTGSSAYFVLTPGYRLHYQQGTVTSATTVLSETRLIDGVEARAVEDRELKNGQVVEVTRDYYAIDRATGDVYYFGEDVDVYKGGKITGHGGSWLSGLKGARFGLMVPGAPKAGRKFYQEHAPGAAMDRVEIVAVNETVTTPAGTFKNCVHLKETTPLEPGVTDHKWYAPGVGLVKDGDLLLVRIEKAK